MKPLMIGLDLAKSVFQALPSERSSGRGHNRSAKGTTT